MTIEDDPVDVWFTMGPKSIDPEVVNSIIKSGATGVRLTFSYGTPELQSQYANLVKNASEAVEQPCNTIADLAGQQVRLGDLGGNKTLSVEEGDEIVLVPTSSGYNETRFEIPIDSKEFLKNISEDDRLIIGDGSLAIKATNTADESVNCEVLNSGQLERNRGIVVQSGDFEPASLTEEDKKDLKYIADMDSDIFDIIALSFVSKKEDVLEAKKILNSGGNNLPIVSKIETKSGVENIDEIAKVSDAIMIARGDLALYLPWSELGKYTYEVVEKSNAQNTPWIMATQVVEGLSNFAFPTRAEICDLYHWMNKGMSGVLLSHETAFGEDPAHAVECTRKLVKRSK